MTQAPGNGSDGQSWRTGLECNSAVEPQSRIPEMGWGSGPGVEHLLLHKRSWVPLPAHTHKQEYSNHTAESANKKCFVYLFIYLRYIIKADFNFLHSAGWPASVIIGNHRHQPLESSPAPNQPSAGVGPSVVCALHSEVTLGSSRAEPWFFCSLHPLVCLLFAPLQGTSPFACPSLMPMEPSSSSHSFVPVWEPLPRVRKIPWVHGIHVLVMFAAVIKT